MSKTKEKAAQKRHPPVDEFKGALDNYTCPYCRHIASSSSGRTLHLRGCPHAKPNITAARTLAVGARVRYQTKNHKIVKIKDGLILLDNGEIGPATKMNIAKEEEQQPSIIITSPKTAHEWVKSILDRDETSKSPAEKRKWVLVLYRLTGYAKHMKWAIEDITAALDKLCPIPTPTHKKK